MQREGLRVDRCVGKLHLEQSSAVPSLNPQIANIRIFGIEIGRIELIRNDLESGERDLSIGDIGFRVCDLKIGFGLGFRI